MKILATRDGENLSRLTSGSISVIVLLAAVSYSVTVNVVNWMTVDVLTYPVRSVAPFVVISGAILTIPVVIPTVLVSMKIVE